MTRRLRRILPPLDSLAGLLDQAVISLANLAVGFLVLQLGSREEFGLYGLGYATITLMNGVSSALFASPLTVAHFRHEEGSRPGLSAAFVLGHGGLSWAGGALAVAGLCMVGADAVVVLTAAACPAAMAHDFSRARRFLLSRQKAALMLDVVNAALWIGLTLAGWWAGYPAHLAALGAYALACAATGLLGVMDSRAHFAAGLNQLRPALWESWSQGRWALAGLAVAAAQNQAHVYILALMKGAETVAEVNAARLLMAPVSFVLIGLQRTLIPRLARLHAAGEEAEMRRQSRLARMAVLAATFGWALAIAAAWDVALKPMLPEGYHEIGILVAAWTLVFAAQAISAGLSAQLQAMGSFRSLMLMNLVTAVPVVVAAVPLILVAGAPGSMAAMAAGHLALAFLLQRAINRQGGRMQSAA
ncbi:lipopolysaccharide biosynthesis protein [Roseococcus sp. YIM B11640]|uniref:lipopolysaccharide biosynthesis protein n=1 Tax=Roseococcus sp. YIM B11640 TaxID=3133973 RepID=UPI003C7CCD4B